MDSILKGVMSLPVANVLIIAGVIFLLIAVLGDISGKIAPGKTGRIAAGIIGGIILVTGLAIHTTERSPAVTATKPQMSDYEQYVNRPGGDYKSFAVAEPQACRDACAGESQCMAFTYVKPGVQGSTAVCWLKNAVPVATPDTNCISGVKK